MVIESTRIEEISNTQKCHAQVLGEQDDLASFLILDSMLGFQTHKMKFLPLPPKPDLNAVKNVISMYRRYGDEHTILNELILLLGECWEVYFENNTISDVMDFKEHVSFCHYYKKVRHVFFDVLSRDEICFDNVFVEKELFYFQN